MVVASYGVGPCCRTAAGGWIGTIPLDGADAAEALDAHTKQLGRAPWRIHERAVKKWQCIVCGWIYDEAEGCEEEGIAPGTRWEDVPEDFVCPECGVGKEDFEMIEIG